MTVERIRERASVIVDQIGQMVQDPRGHTVEIAALAIFAMLVAIFLFLLVLTVREAALYVRDRRDAGVSAPFAYWLRAVVGGVLGVSAVVLLVSITPMVPPVGRVCGVCHTMDTAVRGWTAGTHSGVSCYGCHAPPGLLGAVATSAGGLVRLIHPVERESHVYEAGCGSCHQGVAEGIVGTRIRMRHADVLAARVSCIECHGDVGHAAVEGEQRGMIARNRMSLCLTCHDDLRASSECSVCHDGRSYDLASAPVSPECVGVVRCEGCHREQTEAVCHDCHGMQMPHAPDEFVRTHAGLSSRQPHRCVKCHERARPTLSQACACHDDTPTFHGVLSEWFPQHGEQARRGGAAACTCHETEASCEACHGFSPF